MTSHSDGCSLSRGIKIASRFKSLNGCLAFIFTAIGIFMLIVNIFSARFSLSTIDRVMFWAMVLCIFGLVFWVIENLYVRNGCRD